MKNLFIILMFVPLVSFGQTNPAGNLGKNRPDKYTIKDSRGNKIGTLEGESKPFQGWDYTAPARAAEEARRNSASQSTGNTYSNNNYYSNRNSSNRNSSNRNSSKPDYTYFNSGVDKLVKENYEGAVKDLSKYISQYPSDGDGWRARGRAKTWLDDWDGACYDWKRGAELGSEDAQKNFLEKCNSDGSKKKTSIDWNDEGLEKFEQNDYNGAIADFTKAIELEPENAIIYHSRGWQKYKLEDYNGAIADFTKAIELNPDYANAFKNRGATKQNLKDYYGAIADFTKFIELDPDADSYNYRASAKRRSGDPKGAIEDYTKAIELEPSASNYNMRAVTKRESGDPKGAIVDYDKALSIDPNYTTSIGGKGTAKSYLKDMDGACADWNKAVVTGDDKVAQKAYQEKIDENCLGMTKEKAIAKLKELKELVELEVITQKDYDKEKAILTPIILGKN